MIKIMVKQMSLVLFLLVVCVHLDFSQAACDQKCVTCGETTCQHCPEAFYHDVASETCPACQIANCKDCSGGVDSCISCKSGFYRSKDQSSCIVMPARCKQFDTSKGICKQCRYQLEGPISDKTDCGPCAENCQDCWYKGADSCDSCKIGYRRTEWYKCEKCADNCEYCHLAGAGKCDSCRRGYKLTGSACEKITCKHNCLCDSPDTSRCDACDKRHTWTKDRKGCLPCLKGCAVCDDSPFECTECEEGKRLDPLKKCASSAILITLSLPVILTSLYATLLNIF